MSNIVSEDYIYNVGFEVLKPLTMTNTILWDVTPFNPTKVHHASKKYISFIFRVKEKAKQVISKKQAASKTFYLQPVSSLAYSFGGEDVDRKSKMLTLCLIN
jgi:hypothetical protein